MDLGRDMFTSVWEGTQISLLIAFIAAVIDMVIGVPYGGISGYYGGRVDDIMQRIVEILIGIPTLSYRNLNAVNYGTRYNRDNYCDYPYRMDWHVPYRTCPSFEI